MESSLAHANGDDEDTKVDPDLNKDLLDTGDKDSLSSQSDTSGDVLPSDVPSASLDDVSPASESVKEDKPTLPSAQTSVNEDESIHDVPQSIPISVNEEQSLNDEVIYKEAEEVVSTSEQASATEEGDVDKTLPSEHPSVTEEGDVDKTLPSEHPSVTEERDADKTLPSEHPSVTEEGDVDKIQKSEEISATEGGDIDKILPYKETSATEGESVKKVPPSELASTTEAGGVDKVLTSDTTSEAKFKPVPQPRKLNILKVPPGNTAFSAEDTAATLESPVGLSRDKPTDKVTPITSAGCLTDLTRDQPTDNVVPAKPKKDPLDATYVDMESFQLAMKEAQLRSEGEPPTQTDNKVIQPLDLNMVPPPCTIQQTADTSGVVAPPQSPTESYMDMTQSSSIPTKDPLDRSYLDMTQIQQLAREGGMKHYLDMEQASFDDKESSRRHSSSARDQSYDTYDAGMVKKRKPLPPLPDTCGGDTDTQPPTLPPRSYGMCDSGTVPKRSPPTPPPKPPKKQEGTDECPISESTNMATTSSPSNMDHTRNSKEVATDNLDDPIAEDDGVFEDDEKGFRGHLGKGPPPCNSALFDKGASVFIETDTLLRAPDAVQRSPSPMNSPEDQLADLQGLTEKTGRNADSGGSGYFSEDAVQDHADRLRIRSGRQESEDIFMTSDYHKEDPYLLRIQELPVTATRSGLEAEIHTAGVDLEDIKAIQMNVYEKEAILHFFDPTAKASAKTTFDTRTMKVDQQELEVLNTSFNTDPLKLFVSGLCRKSVEKNLAEALRKCSVTSTEILPGNTPGTALVTFSCDKDVTKFQDQYNGKAFEGQVIHSHRVEVSRSVMIKISGKRVPTKDEVRGYLEQYGGKERSVTGIIWSFGKDRIVASFRNPRNVTDICTVPEHEMEDYQLTVSPYYPCLDLDSSVLTMPAAVELEGNLKHLAGFWNGSKIYKDKFQDILRRHHGILHHNKDGRWFVLCSVDRLEPNATEKVVRWSDRCLAAITEFSENFSVMDKVHVASECWQEVFEKDLSQTGDNGSLSIMEMHSQDGHLVIAGEIALTSTLMKTIRTREQQIQTWSKKKYLKTHELELLQMLEDKAWKTCTIKPSFDDDQYICFEGASKHVEEAMILLYQKLDRIYKKPVTGYGRMTKDLLKAEPASEYIKDKIKCKHATYAVNEHGVFLYALHEKDIEPAIKILVSCVQIKSHKLQANEVMDSPEWQHKLKELDQRKEGLFQIELTANQVQLVSIVDCFEEIYNDALMFLDSLTVMNSFYEIDLGKWRYLKSNKNDKLNEIHKLCKHRNVELVENEVPERKGFAIRGRKLDCREVLSELQKVVEMVQYQDWKIKDPNFRDFVRSDECIQELVRIELGTKCGLHFEKFSTINHQPMEVASRKQGNQEIVITEGNVTDMIVDIIVNLSDNSLQNMSTLGAAIIERVGFDFQVECDQFIRNKGELPDGQCFLTRVRERSLPFQNIISAAVPVWRGGDQNEEELLKLAIQNCLMATIELDSKTIVIPTPDATLNFPVDVASRVMIKAVNDYICTIEGQWRIEKVYLCAVTTQARHTLEAELRKSEQKSFRTSLVDTDIKVHVVKGELAKQQVGVIVNSGNCDLKLNVGALSKSLLKVAGNQLQKECQDMYPDGIQQSEVAVTTGGNLSCKKVFHGVLESWDGGHGRAEQIMGLFIEKCLSMASEYGQESIAFPAIGTGSLKFQPEFVAELFLDCVYTYKCQNPRTSLRDVYLVVWPKDADTLKGFQDVQATIRHSGGQPKGRYRPFSPQFFSQSSKFMKAFGELSVEIVQGDITKEKTEAIVNSVIGLNLDTGTVSRAIFSAAGPSIQTECKSPENKTAMQRQGLIVTDSGFLDFCKKIIHLEAKVNKNEWRQIIEKCLETANDQGLHSLSFPAIGTGGRGCTAELVASALFSAIRKFSESPRHSLRRIRVVIYQDEMLKTFILEAKKNPQARKSIFSPRRTCADVDTSRGMNAHLYGETSNHVQEAKQRLQELFTTETINLGKKLTEQLHLESSEQMLGESDGQAVVSIGQKHKVCVEVGKQEIAINGWKAQDGQAVISIGQKHKVCVEVGKQEITINGWKAHVHAAKKDIDEFIDKLVW